MTVNIALPSSRSPGATSLPVSPQSLQQLVSKAIDLGWIVNKVQRLVVDGSVVDDLPGLKFKDAAQVFLWQIESAVHQFGGTLHRDGLAANLSSLRYAVAHLRQDELQGSPHAGHEACTLLMNTVTDFHLCVLGALTADNYKFGKAYLLGYELACLYRVGVTPTDAGRIVNPIDPAKISRLIAMLADLHLVLPRNAAGTISLSLQITARHLAAARGSDEREEFDFVGLRLQGHRWRAMLTGESPVTDILETADYLTAARTLTRNFKDLLWHAVRQLWMPLAILAVLFACGVAASFWSATGNFRIIGALLSFATTFMAAIRLVSPGLIRVVEKAGPKLWDEAVMNVVAQALPLPAPQPDYYDLEPKWTLARTEVSDRAGRPHSRRRSEGHGRRGIWCRRRGTRPSCGSPT